ncbi:MAG: alkanesulfonate monooxygenase [Blastocatellia bacterium]|jgi:alkanesulfonate monooxygenase|nr:alkanesulfonate monooxygenase [Blastocatellia bacterium]
MPLRFHWRLPHGGETAGATRIEQANLPAIGLPDLDAQVPFCRRAEECGIDSLLTDFGFAKPDSILLAAALGMATEKIKFIVAYRSGLLSPTTFVQQLNTLSALIRGRFSLNIVAGYSPEEQRSYGDFLSHDERYERTDEFLSICRSFWRRDGEVNFEGKYYKVENGKLSTPFVSSDRTFPEIFIAGSSPPARKLALRQGTCWMRLGDAPANLRADAEAISRQGIDVGLRLSVIAGPTRQDAVDAANSLVADFDTKAKEKQFVQSTDSKSIKATYELARQEWLTPYLWTGAVRSYGTTAIALVGSAEDVAAGIMEYKQIGVSQFILSGWPKLESMTYFGREVLPIIREKEMQIERHQLAARQQSS